VIALTATACSLAACASLTGLDQITEDDCAPDGCRDGSVVPDVGAAPGEGGPGVGRDGFVPPESAVDGSAHDGGEAAADVAPEDSAGGGQDAAADADAAQDVAAEAPPDAPADSGCEILFQDSFDDNTQGWTLDTSWSIAPTCVSPPAPQKGNPDPTGDHTGAPGSGVAGAYPCGNNPTGHAAAFRYATSPAVDVSGAPAVKLAFWRWLNSDASEYMTSTVDVFDGSTWVNVYTNPSGAGNLVTDAAWTRQEYDVTAHRNAAFRVRFGYAIVSTNVYAMSVWNVDDVRLSTASCQ
jgi:hypothetical protein